MLPRNKSSEQIAEAFGITSTTLGKWVKNGCPCNRQGKKIPRRFSEEEVASWKKANVGPRQGGRPAQVGSNELLKVRIRKENALARRAELEVAKEEGKLVERATEDQKSLAKIQEVKAGLLSMGATLAPRMDGLATPERQQIIDDYVNALLERFAQ